MGYLNKRGFLTPKANPNSLLAPAGSSGASAPSVVSTAGQAIGLLLALTKAS